MIDIKFKNSKFVSKLFEAIEAIIDETKLQISPETISLVTIDDGRICTVGIKLHREDFEEYRCDEPLVTIGLSVKDLVKVLKRATDEDEIRFRYSPTAVAKRMDIEIKDKKNEKCRRFGIQLLELGDQNIRPDQLDAIVYDSSLTMPMKYLEEAIKDAEIFSKTVEISVERSAITFKSEGEAGESEASLTATDSGISGFKCDIPAKCTFALEYLKKILKISAITDDIELSASSNTPLKARFKLLTCSDAGYYLAPRVDEVPEED